MGDRGPGARSTQAEPLRATHETFADLVAELPHIDIDIDLDTSTSTAHEIADRVFDLLDLGEG